MEDLKSYIKQYIRETLPFMGKSAIGMLGFGKFEKYGDKDNKSNQQVALIRILFFILIISFLVIVLRLSYIVTFKGEEYKRMVYSQRQTSDIVIPCERGSIYDAKGTVLASKIKKNNVILDAKQVTDYSKQMGNSAYIESTAEALPVPAAHLLRSCIMPIIRCVMAMMQRCSRLPGSGS